MFRAVRSTAAALLLVGALSGCSLIGAVNQTPPTTDPTPSATAEAGGTEQTDREACDLLIPILTDANDRMSAAFAALQDSGPEAMSPLLHSLSDDLHTSLGEITNADVNEVFGAFVDSVDTLSSEIDDLIAGGGDQDALLAASKDVNDTYEAISPVCQAAY